MIEGLKPSQYLVWFLTLLTSSAIAIASTPTYFQVYQISSYILIEAGYSYTLFYDTVKPCLLFEEQSDKVPRYMFAIGA